MSRAAKLLSRAHAKTPNSTGLRPGSASLRATSSRSKPPRVTARGGGRGAGGRPLFRATPLTPKEGASAVVHIRDHLGCQGPQGEPEATEAVLDAEDASRGDAVDVREAVYDLAHDDVDTRAHVARRDDGNADGRRVPRNLGKRTRSQEGTRARSAVRPATALPIPAHARQSPSPCRRSPRSPREEARRAGSRRRAPSGVGARARSARTAPGSWGRTRRLAKSAASSTPRR